MATSTELDSAYCGHNYICSIIPDFFLQRVLDNTDAEPICRRSCERTLYHTRRIREARREKCSQCHPRSPPQSASHQAALPSAIGGAQSQTTIPPPTSSSTEKPQENFAGTSKPTTAATPPAPLATKRFVREIYDCQKLSFLPGTIVLSEVESKSADPNANEVYSHFKNASDFLFNVLKRYSLDDNGLTLTGCVHFDDDDDPTGYNNAIWDGTRIICGDGDGVIYNRFTRSLDIIAHELGHGVVQYTANLPYSKQSGALNESFADAFGSMVKQYVLGQTAAKADWLIGKEILTQRMLNKGGRALRDMKNPGSAFKNLPIGTDPQPRHMSGYVNLPDDGKLQNDNGGVHVNSGIPNRAFYLAATALGGSSWEKAGPIWYAAIADRRLFDYANAPGGVNYDSCFPYFANLTIEHALRLFGEDAQAKVKKAWIDVGVLP